jgi:cobalt/nickel transport system permease protein
MHIPDGFLSTPVWFTLDAAAIPTIGWLARRAQAEVEDSRIPLLGVMGAFVFAAQMINFPVAIGTSSHLVGAALLAYTLGPWAASLVMTAILAIQAFVFQDGGIMALGANLLNMALVGVWAAWIPYRHFRGTRSAVFFGAFLSLISSACLAMTQLLVSGVHMPGSLIAISTGVFVASALIEGAITVAVIQAIERINPRWVRQPEARGGSRVAGVLLSVALLLAVAGVLFASAAPDGLEHALQQAGIASHETSLYRTVFNDYQLQGFDSPWLRKALPGVVGLAAIYFVCRAIGSALRRRVAA